MPAARHRRSINNRPLRKKLAWTAAVLSVGTGALATIASSATPTVPLGYEATDGGSMSFITRAIGAQAMWDAGITGKGVDVALIDTGVAPVPGLDRSGKVIFGPDLSFDSQSGSLPNVDANGHGTHMASIIAGTDVASGLAATGCATCLGKSQYSDTTQFVGVAPDSRVVAIKAGAADGAVDVTQVIAAINWVIEHRKDNGMNIRVLNLSYGTDSTQSSTTDPLAFAVEAAWRAGIVVVAAAGNDGLAAPSLGNPALDPAIIAVGSVDLNGTVDTADDLVPTFAQHGDAYRSVDFIAPGTHVLGLRVPSSYVDSTQTTGKVGTRFQRGSGTSQSTAVVSGLAALLVQKYPTATPDQIKAMLVQSGHPLYHVAKIVNGLDLGLPAELTNLVTDIGSAVDAWWEGSGSVDVSALVPVTAAPKVTAQALTAKGTGSVELSRGTSHLISGTKTLNANVDIFGRPFGGATWAKATLAGTTWTGGTYNGAKWTGTGWLNSQWTGVRWSSLDWAGAKWTGAKWTGLVWDGAKWTGAKWTDAVWAGAKWTGAKWTDSSWAGVRWSDASWI
jgi:serine protease AprX